MKLKQLEDGLTVAGWAGSVGGVDGYMIHTNKETDMNEATQRLRRKLDAISTSDRHMLETEVLSAAVTD